MRVLLDTHIYLWWLLDSPRLSESVAEVIAEPSTVVEVSAASIWEASIKSSFGRLTLDDIDLVEELSRNGFSELPVTASHGWSAGQLPPHHRDPFDRLLVAQAQSEQLLLVTDDHLLSAYQVTILGH